MAATVELTADVAPDAGRRREGRTSAVVLGAAGIAGWLLVWQWATAAGPLTGAPGIPTAGATLAEAALLGSDPSFWEGVGRSLLMGVIGLAIGLILGLVMGVASGASRTVFALLDPVSQFLRPIPPVVVLPLLLLIVGPNDELAIILAAVGAFWPVMIQSQAGVRDIDPVALETARAMMLSRRATLSAVVLPSALPYVATGLRIGASLSLMLSIGAGILAGSPGLGQAIATAQQTGQPEIVFGMLLWSGLLGVVLFLALSGLERRMIVGRRTEVAS